MQNEPTPSQVSVVEKLSSTTISVRWSDPCLGHYESQIWGVGLAQADAVCVLSGKPIRRGDPIFRPRVNRTHAPINRHRMILASAVRCSPGEPSC
ncbi:DUF3331 domain-containing protein [Paraburkholderia nodosa]|uniref:DUF3331 domain-containing protein n=1 Tax=Paraburkholderia nodosa TaxID=392320 RepID=UPI0009E08111|nr:DUF3331 domain-containing protein [Paraburkholderia nodosa]